MSYETLRFEVTEGVATITLNRPEKANAFSLTLAEELCDAAGRCDHDPEVRAVILTGEGRFFSAGGDLSDFAGAGERMGQLLAATTHGLHGAVSRFHRMDPPVIVALNGTAAGGGFSLAISGDLVIASERAKLTMGYGKIALTPDGTSTYFLPRLVGLRRAQELMLTDRVLGAKEAQTWGLVTEVVTPEALMERAGALAARLAAGPTLAFGGAKRLLAATYANPLETQAELEARSIAGLTRSDDAREGIAAFLEKRDPVYRGR